MGKVIYRDVKELVTEESRGVKKPANVFLSSKLVQIALVGIAIFLFYSVYNSIKITSEKLEISKRAKQEVDELRLKNLELELALESMQTPEYLEVQARDRLNFSGENEYIFVIPESLLEHAKEGVNTYLYGNQEKVQDPTYIVWYEFLKYGI
ncbi:septum formation initiator family protein [Candidatus Dojkabacteria bacterium]|jgi:cell division protein FtsB|nr:septum formation initiator family protein [Candidatus Dojkabacteria bacterium]